MLFEKEVGNEITDDGISIFRSEEGYAGAASNRVLISGFYKKATDNGASIPIQRGQALLGRYSRERKRLWTIQCRNTTGSVHFSSSSSLKKCTRRCIKAAHATKSDFALP